MIYRSTRGNGERLRSTGAVLQGLASDGGLFVPEEMDFSSFDYRTLLSMSTLEMSEKILSVFLDDFSDMKTIVADSYRNKFETGDLTPLREVGGRYVLELFRGPTSAFKDVALSVLPHLMTAAMKEEGEEREILILTATSGDTGKAALEGFSDVPGIRIQVFFPDGGVSPVQKLQMTTQRGNNVCSTAVRGNFDDAQTGVKRIFARVSREGLPEGSKEVVLSSANSINIGRLVPQIVYYFKAYADLVNMGRIREGEKVDYTVPTGNFGDILAGYLAKCMGLPVGKLICASNENNVLTDFIRTGIYDRNRPFVKTVSPSMDILVSSNLERLLYFLTCDCGYVRERMEELSRKGRYEVTPEILKTLRESFSCGFASEAETKEAIRRTYEEYGYLMDTHTAVGWQVAEVYEKEDPERNGRPNVVLSTASPYKFPQTVAESIGLPRVEDEFEAMELLRDRTGMPVPERLSELRKLPVRFTDVIEKDTMYDYVIGKINE